MKKLMVLCLSLFLGIGVLTGCAKEKVTENGEGASKETKKATEVSVITPDGLPSMAIAKLIKEKPEIKKDYNVKYSISATPDDLSTQVMKGSADIAIVPSNMAAIAYNKNKESKSSDYVIAGTAGFGSFYLVSTEDLGGFDGLKGKTIVNTGKGLTPDITFQAILKEKGLNPESDVTLDYVNAVSELVPMLVSGKATTAVVPEPALSGLMTKKPDVKIIGNLNDEYKKANKSEFGYPQSTVIVKSSFLKENKEFVDAFLTHVSDSIKWAKENPKDLGAYSKEVGIQSEPAIIEKSMERSNLDFEPIKTNKDEYIKYFQCLFDFNPKSLGGSMPDEGIFMEK
ncbi:MAG: ABC transporter substrate-binding protein [Clostridioides sp.]|jgi:NitT/TauT family transport system substrate-binding protein|nr:ABC transporter substrate-binding protein [Clostridioides sp.]